MAIGHATADLLEEALGSTVASYWDPAVRPDTTRGAEVEEEH
ncbi:MAG TPA: hypothetical protein VKM54_02400 [Myxococcota bacterium]|nr:hypothetical protein [Myxococcota bacterium]